MKKVICMAVIACLMAIGVAYAELSFEDLGKLLWENVIKDAEVAPAFSLVENRMEALIQKEVKEWGNFGGHFGIITDDLKHRSGNFDDFLKSFRGIGVGISYEITSGEKLGFTNPILKSLTLEPELFFAVKNLRTNIYKTETDAYAILRLKAKW